MASARKPLYAVIAAAVLLPGGILILIAYLLRTKRWFREDN